MNTRDELNMILQQLANLSEDLTNLARSIGEGNIDDRDDTMVYNLSDFARNIASNLQEILHKERVI